LEIILENVFVAAHLKYMIQV